MVPSIQRLLCVPVDPADIQSALRYQGSDIEDDQFMQGRYSYLLRTTSNDHSTDLSSDHPKSLHKPPPRTNPSYRTSVPTTASAGLGFGRTTQFPVEQFRAREEVQVQRQGSDGVSCSSPGNPAPAEIKEIYQELSEINARLKVLWPSFI